MKKITQISRYVLIMLLAVQLSYSQAEYQLDSIQRFNWDTNGTAFKMNSREHFTYDNDGTKETSYIWYLPSGTVWNPAIRYFKTYDGNNNVIEKLIENYDSVMDVWNPSTKEFYTYDASENVVLSEDFLSSDGGVTWDIPRGEKEYTFNSVNLITEFTRRTYNASTMTMIDLVQETTTYNGLLKADEISKTWSSSGSIWIYNIKIEYTYTSDLPIQKDYFRWLGSDWDPQAYLQIVYTYDGDLLTEEIGLAWDPSGSIWENDFRITRTYDANGNVQEVITYDWDDNTSTWLNDKQELWYWDAAGEVLDLDEAIISKVHQVYVVPNPASRYFTIKNLIEDSYVEVYNSSGIKVLDVIIQIDSNGLFSGSGIISVESYPSGFYIVHIKGLNTANLNLTRKLIINN